MIYFFLLGVIIGYVSCLVITKIRNACKHEFQYYQTYNEICEGVRVGVVEVTRCRKCGKFRRQTVIGW